MSDGSLALDEYQGLAQASDKSRTSGTARINFLLMGLYGEVGSLLSELKKKQRDKHAYFAYEKSAIEELGDVLWYLSAMCSAIGIRLSAVADAARLPVVEGLVLGAPRPELRFRELQPQTRLFGTPVSGPKVEKRLLVLGGKVGRLLELVHAGNPSVEEVTRHVVLIFRALIEAADDAEIDFGHAASENLEKVSGRWPEVRKWGDRFDSSEDIEERFPDVIEITFKERLINGKKFVVQKCNGVNIGDPLTDNSAIEDDYRFHDVFHISFAAILGWSPVLRALLKRKRKNHPAIDEQQDGARAIITEEGISNWVFSHGLRHDLFANTESLDFALLKTIRNMVIGYEVQQRPLWMWEHAILEGFRVFRLLKENRGGVVTANLAQRALAYTPYVKG